jgi:hypothetical protein
MAILRRKRLQDGTFGELEKVFSGETQDEKIERLEREKNDLQRQLVDVQSYIVEQEYQKLLSEGGLL